MSLCIKERESIKKAISEVHSSSSDTNWVICGHPQGRRTEFSLVASGNGGIDEFSTHLDDNQVMYGLVCLKESSKFILVRWFGASVELTNRTYSSHAAEIAVLFMPYQGWIDLSTKVNITEKSLMPQQKQYSLTVSYTHLTLPTILLV